MEYIEFRDFYNNQVKLSFTNHPFSQSPKHVWVISWYKNNWLLTEHPRRGIEFPGGKVEPGESAEEAAVREVYEETGGKVDDIHYIGQYKVDGKGGTIIKNVYFATISNLELKDYYFETKGPVLLKKIPDNVKFNSKYSFMMKDLVLEKCMELIINRFSTVINGSV